MSDPFVILRFAAGFLALAAGLIILVLGLAAAATLLIAARVEARIARLVSCPSWR